MLETIHFRWAVLCAATCAAPLHAQTTRPAANAPARPSAPAQATRAANDPVLATVNGEAIHQSEIANLLDQFMIPPGSEEQAYRDAVELLINTKLLAQFLAEQKITVAPAEVDQVVTQYEQNFKQQGTDLMTALAESNTSLSQFRDRIARSLQWKTYVTARATDAELKKYADQNKDVFNNTLVRASHILVAVEPDASAEEKQKAMEKIESIKKEIDEGKISFADAANKHSEDPGNQAKPSGGDLDFFPRKGQFIEPFTQAAFGLQKGQISGPVETEYGYHLIHVTDRREGKPFDFEQLKPQILASYAADLQEAIVTGRREKAEVKIEPMPAGLVKTEVPPPAPSTGGAPAQAQPAATKGVATPAAPQPPGTSASPKR